MVRDSLRDANNECIRSTPASTVTGEPDSILMQRSEAIGHCEIEHARCIAAVRAPATSGVVGTAEYADTSARSRGSCVLWSARADESAFGDANSWWFSRRTPPGPTNIRDDKICSTRQRQGGKNAGRCGKVCMTVPFEHRNCAKVTLKLSPSKLALSSFRKAQNRRPAR